MMRLKFFAGTVYLFIFCISSLGCIGNRLGAFLTRDDSTNYSWSNITTAAKFPQGYNYPVFVLENQSLLALNNGGWISQDGKNWTKTSLPESGLNSGYQKFVQFKGAIYSLGTFQGNYLNFKISTKIFRTKDGKSWETLAEKSNLPERVFYGAVVFKNKIWLIGGFDGKKYYNDVWTSENGINWTQIAEKTAWSGRTPSVTIVFKDKIWLMGGGVIDGESNNNPNSYKEVWTSEDGANWKQVKTNSSRKWRGNPVVFDNKLWLAGANRGGTFESAVWVSEDGTNWKELSAPWSPRGAVAVWVFNDRLYLTGGKSSYVENGETKFVYSNDVWAMSKVGN